MRKVSKPSDLYVGEADEWIVVKSRPGAGVGWS